MIKGTTMDRPLPLSQTKYRHTPTHVRPLNRAINLTQQYWKHIYSGQKSPPRWCLKNDKRENTTCGENFRIFGYRIPFSSKIDDHPYCMSKFLHLLGLRIRVHSTLCKVLQELSNSQHWKLSVLRANWLCNFFQLLTWTSPKDDMHIIFHVRTIRTKQSTGSWNSGRTRKHQRNSSEELH